MDERLVGLFNRYGIRGLLPHLGIEYARTVQSTGGFALPEDWLEVGGAVVEVPGGQTVELG